MPHNEHPIAFSDELAKRMGNDAGADACPLFHRVRFSAIKLHFSVSVFDRYLIAAAPERQIQARLRKRPKFWQWGYAGANADAQRELGLVFGRLLANLIQNRKFAFFQPGQYVLIQYGNESIRRRSL